MRDRAPRLSVSKWVAAVIPPRVISKIHCNFDPMPYRQRNHIERTFTHFKQFCRLATRFDKLKLNFHTIVADAYTSLWLR